jgi:vacuolar-type H+-ATPase subunit H
MADKNFLSWVGFKGEDESKPAPTQNALERIRELETQLNDLRSRRDITGLSREEFEILATETAMAMIKSAQQREAKANTAAQRLISETNRSTKEKLESAESKAKSILTSAESRGRKYITAAEDDAADLVLTAEGEADEILNQTARDAAQLTSAAKRDAQRLIENAAKNIVDYKSWLSSAISEAERLHRAQNSSLNAAENAIQESRQKLKHAFERLSQLQMDINANLDSDNRPAGKAYVAGAGKKAAAAAARKQKAANKKKPAVKKSPTKKKK